jgi:hypothetical protein
MTKPSTKIKNIIESHVRGAMFGLNIWGQHEIPTHDTITLIEVCGPSRFERYGSATVYHPTLGKWLCDLHTSDRRSAGAHLRGTPRLVMGADEIKAALAGHRSPLEALYRVYGVPIPDDRPVVVWDAFNA